MRQTVTTFAQSVVTAPLQAHLLVLGGSNVASVISGTMCTVWECRLEIMKETQNGCAQVVPLLETFCVYPR